MLDVGFSEILLTSAIALIVLGPERLPKVARQVGNWMGRARAMARQLSEQLEREVSAEELLKTQNPPNRGAGSPASGANLPQGGASVHSYPPPTAPGVAPPVMAAPEAGAVSPAAAPPGEPTALAAPAASPPPEPVYGLAAALTTPAAMHAHDPPVTDPRTADPQAATNDRPSLP